MHLATPPSVPQRIRCPEWTWPGSSAVSSTNTGAWWQRPRLRRPHRRLGHAPRDRQLHGACDRRRPGDGRPARMWNNASGRLALAFGTARHVAGRVPSYRRGNGDRARCASCLQPSSRLSAGSRIGMGGCHKVAARRPPHHAGTVGRRPPRASKTPTSGAATYGAPGSGVIRPSSDNDCGIPLCPQERGRTWPRLVGGWGRAQGDTQ